MSIADWKFCTHMFNRSSIIHSHLYDIHKSPRVLVSMLALLMLGNSENVGYDLMLTYFTSIPQHLLNARLNTIKVKSQMYDIIDQIFFNFLICGQGTSSWHVHLGKTHYVIKDSWTHAVMLSRPVLLDDLTRRSRDAGD